MDRVKVCRFETSHCVLCYISKHVTHVTRDVRCIVLSHPAVLMLNSPKMFHKIYFC
jgi:hypothetical protein